MQRHTAAAVAETQAAVDAAVSRKLDRLKASVDDGFAAVGEELRRTRSMVHEQGNWQDGHDRSHENDRAVILGWMQRTHGGEVPDGWTVGNHPARRADDT